MRSTSWGWRRSSPEQRTRPFGGGEPQDRLDLRAHVGGPTLQRRVVTVVPRGVPRVDGGGEILDQQPVAGFGLAELGLDAPALADLQAHHLRGLFELCGPCQDPPLQVVVRLAQSLLRLFLGGDVEHHALPRRRLRHRFAHEHGLVAHPHLAPIVRDEAVLPAPRFARSGVRVVRRELDLAVVRMEQLAPDVGLVEPLLAAVPQDRLDVRAHERRPSLVVGTHLVDHGRHLLDQHAEA